jgi:resuscitation-promoting factor RpfA
MIQNRRRTIARVLLLAFAALGLQLTVPAVASADPASTAWAKLRMCESSGRYATNTGNGYYGAYQFDLSTWNTLGTGYSYPHLAPPEVQDAAAQRLQARSGWGQWPSCARALGLV